MKLFDKPWLEIVNINMNEVIVTSPSPDNGDPDIADPENPIEEYKGGDIK